MKGAGIAMIVLLLGGCKTTVRERLEGTWVGETVENFPPEQAGKALGWVRGASFRFKGSRVTVTIPAETPREGTYEVAQVQNERDLLLSFRRPEGVTDAVAFQLDEEGGRLRWGLDRHRTIVFRKLAD